ncbi:hypothetical protein CR513_11529, partial [Mucuna pruriens]
MKTSGSTSKLHSRWEGPFVITNNYKMNAPTAPSRSMGTNLNFFIIKVQHHQQATWRPFH